jgi:biotin transport system substrate-specific component
MVSKVLVLNKVNEKVKDLILIIAFAFLTAIGSKIKIEIGIIPITFQTFFVFLSGIVLGSKKGALAQIVYLLLGLLGFPFFARGGGLFYIFSPTFGYIIGFIFASFISGFLKEKSYSYWRSLLILIFANITIYLFGLIYLANFLPKEQLLKVGLYPFIFGDLFKIHLLLLLFYPPPFRKSGLFNIIINFLCQNIKKIT